MPRSQVIYMPPRQRSPIGEAIGQAGGAIGKALLLKNSREWEYAMRVEEDKRRQQEYAGHTFFSQMVQYGSKQLPPDRMAAFLKVLIPYVRGMGAFGDLSEQEVINRHVAPLTSKKTIGTSPANQVIDNKKRDKDRAEKTALSNAAAERNPLDELFAMFPEQQGEATEPGFAAQTAIKTLQKNYQTAVDNLSKMTSGTKEFKAPEIAAAKRDVRTQQKLLEDALAQYGNPVSISGVGPLAPAGPPGLQAELQGVNPQKLMGQTIGKMGYNPLTSGTGAPTTIPTADMPPLSEDEFIGQVKMLGKDNPEGKKYYDKYKHMFGYE